VVTDVEITFVGVDRGGQAVFVSGRLDVHGQGLVRENRCMQRRRAAPCCDSGARLMGA
jgi:hypothetical protein